jgi:hypothetical protein
MPKKFVFAGCVASGHDPNIVGPKLLETLQKLDAESAEVFSHYNRTVVDAGFVAPEGHWAAVDTAIDELVVRLGDKSPDGYWFGLDPVTGSEYGYWPMPGVSSS